MDDLKGDTAVVTGAGRRLGRLYALELARAGVSIVINDVDEAAADRVVAEIEASGGQAARAIGSVTDPEVAAAVVKAAVDRFGRLDILINNAGFMRNAYVEDITSSMLDEVLAVSICGSFHMSKAAWPVMKETGYGRIVMTSSSGGMFGMSASANYAAAKAGVYGLMKALAIEGSPHGIAVNAVLPNANPLDDDNAHLELDESSKWSDHNWGTPAVEDYLTPAFLNVLDRRDPGLVTPLVLFLASRSCQISGEAFSAGMGRFARVFVSEGSGWRRGDDQPATPADIAANLEAVRSTKNGIVPWDLMEEHEYLSRMDG